MNATREELDAAAIDYCARRSPQIAGEPRDADHARLRSQASAESAVTAVSAVLTSTSSSEPDGIPGPRTIHGFSGRDPCPAPNATSGSAVVGRHDHQGRRGHAAAIDRVEDDAEHRSL
jgi:hypothetical protein